MAQRLDERLVRQQRVLVRAPVEDRAAVGVHLLGEVSRQPGLADTGLADEHDEPRLTRAALKPARAQPHEAGLAADEGAVDRRRRDGGKRQERGVRGGPCRRPGGSPIAQEAPVQRDGGRGRTGAELVPKEDTQPLERAQGLRDVPSSRLNLHQQGVSTLPKRPSLDERARRALGRGEVASTQLEGRPRGRLERPRLELSEMRPPALHPLPLQARKQWLGEHCEGGLRRMKRRLGVAVGQRVLGVLGLLGRLLDIHVRVGRQIQREQLAPDDQTRPQCAPHLRQHAAEGGFGRGGQIRWPEDLQKLIPAHGTEPVQDQVGEQRPALSAGELACDQAAAELDLQLAEQGNSQVFRQRGHSRGPGRQAACHRRGQSVAAMVTR
jgi:hypothetical protein